MLFFKQHPFAVSAHFEQSLVLTYAVAAAEVRALVPKSLDLDLYGNDTAFIAVALVEVSAMRPACLPSIMGNKFTLFGYRVFVRFKGSDGRSRRGLYILGSETNSRFMCVAGNLATRYNYSKVAVDWKKKTNGQQEIGTDNGLYIKVATDSENIALPQGSPFKDWREARKFAGPMPFTFSYEKAEKKMVTVEGVRKNWTPKPTEILLASVPFLEQFNLNSIVLANAFRVSNVPYHWKRGVVEDCV